MNMLNRVRQLKCNHSFGHQNIKLICTENFHAKTMAELGFVAGIYCICQCVVFSNTVSLSKLASSSAPVMCCSFLTWNVCLGLICLLCINLCPAAGGKVTARQMRTSRAVWKMVAAIPLGHSDGTTSILPPWKPEERRLLALSALFSSALHLPLMLSESQ